MYSLTHEELNKTLSYSPESGLFTWLIKRGTAFIGMRAGCIDPGGYHVIRINKTNFFAHRLAWLATNKIYPLGQIDHANGIRNDNRIINLRECTAAENQQNRLPRKAGKGVTFHSGVNKFQSSIKVNGKNIYLGIFSKKEDAISAYDVACVKYFGEFARPNSGSAA